MSKIKTALISVSDKNGIIEFARELCELGFQIISTGGTARLLSENRIDVTEISEHTGFPEIMDGRVKTLHPKVHGGILSIRNNDSHISAMREHNIPGIDLVAVNLYPFEKTIQKPGVALDEVIENIDIGGPSMIRSAAKNHKFVTVVVNAEQYRHVIDELKTNGCSVSEDFRFRLAVEAFNHTYKYDRIIAGYLETLPEFRASSPLDETEKREPMPETLTLELTRKQELRYGENPHQSASFYVEERISGPCVANARILNGKELSFNNILDINAAWEIVTEFEQPASIVIKHTNPCGASCADRLSDAFINAYNGDPLSAFGCILGFNKRVDIETAKKITEPGHFVEAIIAPDYEDEAIEMLTSKRKWGANLRILKTGAVPETETNMDKEFDLKRVGGGLLVQERNMIVCTEDNLRCVTNKMPSDKEMVDLKFALTICKHVKSNGIVFAKDKIAVGVGAGQMSRIDAAELAIKRAGEMAQGSVMASDAFFPFRDTIDMAGRVGISAVIQPGGSNRDNEVIDAANEHNISMIFTGVRHFKH